MNRCLNKYDIRLLANGIDSLYLTLDYNLLNCEYLMGEVEKKAYDESFKLRGLNCIRVKAFIKMYPVCFKVSQFMLFINRKTMYIKVLSLGFELWGYEKTVIKICEILDKLTLEKANWLDVLKISRIDVYLDFHFAGDFNPEQFKTKLRRKGIWKSGENAEAVTFYFGTKESILVRLYVKSEEIKKSGKEYLKTHWEKFGCKDSRVWRCEFEYHRDKLLELAGFRELSFFDNAQIKKLFAYGLDAIEYVKDFTKREYNYRKALHPIWQALKKDFDVHYEINKKSVKRSNVFFRQRLAKKYVTSWLAARELKFEDVPELYITELQINKFDYEKSLNKVLADYKRNNE